MKKGEREKNRKEGSEREGEFTAKRKELLMPGKQEASQDGEDEVVKRPATPLPPFRSYPLLSPAKLLDNVSFQTSRIAYWSV